MDRLHRIFSNGDRAFKVFLDDHEIPHKYEESALGRTVFLLISESDPSWPTLSEYLERHDVLHTTELRFTRDEVLGAHRCRLGVTSHFGYPEPSDDFGFTEVTYQPAVGCRTCGIGLVQARPFRFRKVPTHRRSQLLQLNWVFDEFFVSAQAGAQLERAGVTGLRFEAPVLHNTGEAVPGWLQMCVDHTLPPGLATQDLVVEECGTCGRTKYNYPRGGPLALARRLPDDAPDAVKSAEWFGSGGSAHRLVLVSRRVVQLILVNGWRGVDLEPLSDAPES